MTLIATLKRLLEGLVKGNNKVAENYDDDAQKAFRGCHHFATSAAATTATVGETILGVAPFDKQLKIAYFVTDGTTLAADSTAYATVKLYKRTSDGTSTTLATWASNVGAFTDSVPTLFTAGSTDWINKGEVLAYCIDKSSATTNAAVPAGRITADLERMS